MKIEELYELDRDDLIKELEKATGLTITNEPIRADLHAETFYTADGYDVFAIHTGIFNDISFENDIYYYQPPAEDILERLLDLYEGDKVYLGEMEYLNEDEGAIIDFLEMNYSERYEEEEVLNE